MKKSKWLMMLSVLASVSAFAQSGNGPGNGGGEDGVFKGIRDEIKVWMEKNIAIHQLETKLELKSMPGAALYAAFTQAAGAVGEKVVFTQEEVKIGNNSRICKNENQMITCNVEAWNSTRGDTRYMIVLHEYLGIAGIEANIESDYSRYPISSKIRNYAHSKESFELGMEKNEQVSLITLSFLKKIDDNVNFLIKEGKLCLEVTVPEINQDMRRAKLKFATLNNQSEALEYRKLSKMLLDDVYQSYYSGLHRNFTQKCIASEEELRRLIVQSLEKTVVELNPIFTKMPSRFKRKYIKNHSIQDIIDFTESKQNF